MTKTSKAKTKAYIMLVAVAALLLMLFSIDIFARENLPEIYEIKAADIDDSFLSFGDIDTLNYTSACAYKEVDADIKIDNHIVSNIKTVLTESNYFHLYNLNMIAGAFFDKTDIEENKQYAVISNTLAMKLYLRNNPIGEIIYIDGYSYAILGVYEDENKLLGKINKDNYDRIYIPAACYPQYEKLTVDSISFANTEMLFSNIDVLLAKYPDYMGNYIHYNYIEKRAFSTQAMPVLLFTLKIVLIIFILRIIYKAIKLIIKKIYSDKETEYFNSILKKNIKELIFLAVFTLSGLMGVLFLAKSLTFPIVIPVSAIPDDNLFDINHYISKILQAFNTENTIDVAGNKYFYLLANRTFWYELLLLTYLYPALIALYSRMKKLCFMDIVSFVEIIGYSVLISLVLILLCIVLDVISFLAINIIIILISFLIILLIDYKLKDYPVFITLFVKFARKFRQH